MFPSLRRTPCNAATKVAGPQARRPRRLHLGLEALECRQVLSTLGPEFVANTKTAGSQFSADNASSASGMAVAVWVDQYSHNSDHSVIDDDIRAQLYDASGQKSGPEIVIDFSTADDTDPAVAMDADGDFVVTWTRDLPGSGSDVMARRYSRAGAPLGDAFAVAAGAKDEYGPDVAMDAAGGFVVSYTSAYSATDHDIYARRYSGGGAPLQTFAVATLGKMERHAQVAMAPDGRFDIVYQREQSDTNADIYLNRYASGGGLLGRHGVATSGDDELGQRVSMDDAGNAVVAYGRLVGGDFDIKARRVSGAGAVGGEINIRSSLSDETNPSVALSRTGGAFVVAYRSSGSGMQVATVTGADAVSPPLDAGSAGSDNQSGTAISLDGSGRFFLTYTSQDKVPSGFGDLNVRGRFGRL